MSSLRVFVSFDLEHDRDLFDLLVAQSAKPSAGFEIAGGSEARERPGGWDDELRLRIREADEVIFLCGEHTGDSMAMQSELSIVREERRPYFLLWGRREIMCTKPAGAKPAEGMYSWTPRILQDQLTMALRNARAEADAEEALKAVSRAKAPASG